MRNYFPFLTTILAFVLCLFSPASCATTPNTYTDRSEIPKRLYTKTSLHHPPVLRQKNLLYLIREVLPQNPQSSKANVKYPKLNTKARPHSSSKILRMKHGSSLSSKIAAKLKKEVSGPLLIREYERLNRQVKADNIPMHQRQSSGGLGFESCSTSSDCAETHFCGTVDESNVRVPCDGQSDCVCYTKSFDDFRCSCKYPECLPGEICYADPDGNFACVSSALDKPAFECPPGTNSPPSENGSGLTSEPCMSSSDCAESHFCAFDNTESTSYCDGQSSCVCLPDFPEDFACSCEEPECLTGEVCTTVRTDSLCVSLALRPTPIDCRTDTDDLPSMEDGSGGSGASLEPCRASSECAQTHFCAFIDEEANVTTCNGESSCGCLPHDVSDLLCSCEEPDCLPGDSCSTIGGDTIGCISSVLGFPPVECQTNEGSPTSPITTPSTTPPVMRPTPVPTELVCIDAKALSHLQTHQLVYKQHAVSRVLCDKFGSCATPGHIIHFKGSTMMMKNYCEDSGCEERIMEVNSPRYKKGMRVASKTDGLEYTVFAARYETRAEEAVLATAVRMGL